MVDNIGDVPETIKAGTKLFQICAPDLRPFNIELVDSLTTTDRGSGGFGSTNKQ
jgi:dUTPase